MFDRRPWCCTYAVKEGDKVKKIGGKSALNMQVNDPEKAFDNQEKVQLSGIDVLQGFSWLLDHDHKTLVGQAHIYIYIFIACRCHFGSSGGKSNHHRGTQH